MLSELQIRMSVRALYSKRPAIIIILFGFWQSFWQIFRQNVSTPGKELAITPELQGFARATKSVPRLREGRCCVILPAM